MIHTDYLLYSIIGVAAFLFILVVILIVALFRNKNIILQRAEQYVPRRCPTCGQILEPGWNRCPSCTEVVGPSKIHPAERSTPGILPIGYLLVKAGADRGRIYKIVNNSITVGSGNQNDIIINDSRISPQHLRIWSADKKFYIQDLQSEHGTKVNNRIIGQAELYDNDLIEIADNAFVFKTLD